MVIEEAIVPTELVRHSNNIQQVLTRTVLLSKQFELMFGSVEELSKTKLRVYNLKTNIENSADTGFYNISIEMINPKINKAVRSEKETSIQGKRLLHSIRIIVLRMIYGEAFLRKNRIQLEKMSALDPLLNLPEPKAQGPQGLQPAKRVDPIEPKKKNYDDVKKGLDKKPEDPTADKKEPVFRDRSYALGAYYQKQAIVSSNSLLDVNNDFTAFLFDFQSNTTFDADGVNVMVLSGRYGKTMSSYEKKIPDSFQFNGLYDRHLFSRVRALAGVLLDKTSFANLPELNAGIQVGTVTTLWGQIGVETSQELFGRRFLLTASLLKSLQSKVDFPGAEDASPSGQGIVAFFAYELTKKYFVALEFSKYSMDIAGILYPLSNSDQRTSVGIFYPLGSK
jgi:hypothetical protein